MNRTVLGKSIKICFMECPFDSVLLIFISIALSILPAAVLYLYNMLIANIYEFNAAVVLIVAYCFSNTAQKSVYHYYHHYYLNYKTLLKFEQKMKENFFKICSNLNLQDYYFPEVVNETRRALNASINIFRVYQIVIEIIAAIIGIILIGGIIVSIRRSLLVFLILAVISPVLDNVYQIIQKKYLLYENTQKQKEEEEYIKLLTKPEHLKEIKILNCFDFIFHKWLNIHQSVIEIEKKTQTKILCVSILFHLLSNFGKIGAYWSITGLFFMKQISIAEFSMIILTFSKVTQFFNQLFSLFGNLSEFSIMVKPYFVFLESTNNRIQNKQINKKESGPEILFKNVSYQYPNADVPALRNIELSIHQGDFVSVVGENGSGKTTLTKIILGLQTPTSGCLEVNFNSTNMESKNFMDGISYIPQIFNCYCISLKDNILFGKPYDNNLLEKSFQDIGLSDLRFQINDLYGLQFGGLELSGGQKQRIVILRAAVRNADILIFDEPTSAIDPLQESQVYQTLLDISKGKTTIMVSHRLTLTKQSNMIVVLKDGEIAEIGNHKELLNYNGEYARMWKAQSNLYFS